MNLVSFESLNIDTLRLTKHFSLPSKPFSQNRISITPLKIKASPTSSPVSNNLKTPLLSARDHVDNSLRHRRIKTLNNLPDIQLQTINKTTQHTTDTSPRTTRKKPLIVLRPSIEPMATSETDLNSHQESPSPKIRTHKRSMTQKLFSSKGSSTERQLTQAEGLFWGRKSPDRKLRPQPLSDLFKEVLTPVPRRTNSCRKREGPDDKDQLISQITNSQLSAPSVKNVAVKTAAGLNFKKPLEMNGSPESNKSKLEIPQINTTARKRTPARHFETEVPSHHRFASDTMYYEIHGDLISKKVAEKSLRYRAEMNGALDEYRQRVNENFHKRFGSTKHTQEQGTDTILSSFQNLDYDVTARGSVESINKMQIRGSMTRRTLQSFPELQCAGASPTRNLRASYRPAAGLPDSAKLKIPEGFQKKSLSEKQGTKQKTLYNPFERRKSSSSSIDLAEEALRDLIELKPKMGTILPPQNPIFKEPAVQSQLMQEIVTGDLKLKLVRPQRVNFKYVRVKLVEVLRNMKLLKLRPRELMENRIFSSTPYEKKYSRELLSACKINDQDTVAHLLEKSKYLVHDFDNMHMTPLHWAVKRGNFAISKMLIDHGANINASDMIGRTPLFFAIKYNCIDIMKLLLHSYCDPWSTEECNYTELCKNKPVAKYYLSKARQIHIILKMAPPQVRDTLWQKESLKLILDPRNSYVKPNPDELD